MPVSSRISLLRLGCVVVFAAVVWAATPIRADDLEQQASALLRRKCLACHGDKKQESGLDLRSISSALKGGESGAAIKPGYASDSLLYTRTAAGEMPPKEDQRLNSTELALLRDWIEHGEFAQAVASSATDLAERSRHWSFQKPVRPTVPVVAPLDGEPAANHPIDAFILARLVEHNLQPGPLADRRTLARRAYFDLLGLPPSPERIEKFTRDEDPQAYEKLVDELLAAPQYGERWGRHWLDVARYADTGGYETDIYFKNAWRYRDYVVKSFNDDKPYDVFLKEQIAGDELWPDNLDLAGTYVMPPEKKAHLEARLGTGLYALGPEIHESNMDAPKLRSERLSDWVDTTGAAFLGLTMGCARCHDHKFDPLTQRDYYGLVAAFAASKVVDLPIVNAMEIADQKQYYPTIVAVDEARKAYRLFEQSKAGQQLSPEEEQKKQELVSAIGRAVLAIPVNAGSTPNTPYDGLLEVPTASVLGHERPELVPTIHLLSRGELSRPKEVVTSRLPQMLAEKTARAPELTAGPGARKELALWLTAPDHPLTARVIVNRVWGWHFGRGLVATANDFGHLGQPPTHPELLDWLACEFVARDWSIKQLHRAMMLSRTYRQSSVFTTDANHASDPDDRYLWRMTRRRLEAETVWDTIHSVAGTINLAIGGRPVMPPLTAEELTDKANWIVSADPQQHTRRGLYVLVRRNFRFPLFDIFDVPVNAVSCAGRDCSTVAPQALWLLNNNLAQRQSSILAARVVREAGDRPPAFIDRLWKLALQRPPTDQERAEALTLFESLLQQAGPEDAPESRATELQPLAAGHARALEQLCLAVLNLNEFLFID